MFTPTNRTTTAETLSRPTPAAFTRTATTAETQDMSRSEMAASQNQPSASSDDWTRECLFDCYND